MQGGCNSAPWLLEKGARGGARGLPGTLDERTETSRPRGGEMGVFKLAGLSSVAH